MLHPLDIMVDDALVEPEQLQEFREQLVPSGDAARERFAGGREDKAAIFLILEQAIGIESLDHVRHARLRDLEAGRDVDDARVALRIDELEDAFEVILGCDGVAGGFISAGHSTNK